MKGIESLIILGGFVLTTLAGPALAHGENHGPARPADSMAAPEQKPFGIAGDPRKVSRTIDLAMTDAMRFFPATIDVALGETIRFRLKNDGKLLHEMVIGTMRDLREHAALMRKFPEMEHSESYMAHVKPGTTEEIVWTFNRPGEFNYACLIAGHFEAGMVGKAIVGAQRAGAVPASFQFTQASPPAPAAMSEGEVRKIDREAAKITLRHGPIANLDMPAMTMVFRVKDPAMLDVAHPGEKVRFIADKVDGALTIIEIAPAH